MYHFFRKYIVYDFLPLSLSCLYILPFFISELIYVALQTVNFRIQNCHLWKYMKTTLFIVNDITRILFRI